MLQIVLHKISLTKAKIRIKMYTYLMLVCPAPPGGIRAVLRQVYPERIQLRMVYRHIWQ